MKKEHKVLILGMILCVVGAVLVDCHIVATGATFLSLGIFTIVLGPIAASI